MVPQQGPHNNDTRKLRLPIKTYERQKRETPTPRPLHCHRYAAGPFPRGGHEEYPGRHGHRPCPGHDVLPTLLQARPGEGGQKEK